MSAADSKGERKVTLTKSVGKGTVAVVSLEHLKSNFNAPVYRVAVIGPAGSGKSTLIGKWVKHVKALGVKVFSGGEFEIDPMLLVCHRATNAKWNVIMRCEGAQIMYASYQKGLGSAQNLFNEVWQAGATVGTWALIKGDSETAHPV